MYSVTFYFRSREINISALQCKYTVLLVVWALKIPVVVISFSSPLKLKKGYLLCFFYCSDILSTSRNTSLCTENCNLFTKIYMGNWTVGYGLYIDVLPKVPEINFFSILQQ